MGQLANARQIWPRLGMEWSLAEDRRLRRLFKKLSRTAVKPGRKYRIRLYESIGNILGRTPMSVSTRLAILKAVDAHVKAWKRRSRR